MLSYVELSKLEIRLIHEHELGLVSYAVPDDGNRDRLQVRMCGRMACISILTLQV